MLTTLQNVFGNLTLLLLLLTVGMGSYRRKYLPQHIKLLLVYFAVNFAISVFARYLWSLSKNNLPLLHLNTWVEFIFFSLYFYYLLGLKDHVKKFFLLGIVGISTLLIANSLLREPLTGFNSQASTLVQTILMGLSIYYFFQAFGKTDFSLPLHQGYSLINFAVILYHSGSLIIFMFGNFFLSREIRLHKGFWTFNAFLYFVFQLLIFIGIWKIAYRPMKSSSS